MRHLGCLAGACLCAAALAPTGAVSQDATWRQDGFGSFFTSASSWTPNVVPRSAATFGPSVQSQVFFAGQTNSTVGAFIFTPDAPAYTFNPGITFTFHFQSQVVLNGAGIINNSPYAPTFLNPFGSVSFVNGAQAGNAVFNVSCFTVGQFCGLLEFNDTSSAANARITNTSSVGFSGSATAGNAAIVTNAGGVTRFAGRATAGNATVVTNQGGSTTFSEFATAGNATLTNVGGTVTFRHGATAGNATITNVSGGRLAFADGTSGGQARIISGSASTVDFGPGNISVGSIEGAGNFVMSSPQPVRLTTGTNGLSTEVSGTISGSAGRPFQLVKVGAGILTLSGANTFTGETRLDGGGLVVNGSLASNLVVNVGSAVVNGSVAGTTVMNGGTLGGGGALANLTVNNGTLAPGNSIGTLTVNGNLLQNAVPTYLVDVSSSQSDRINVGGSATIGGTVAIQTQPGSYAARNTYTILSAAGGVSGTYAALNPLPQPFLQSVLSYDANNVYLTLQAAGFSAGAQTPTSYAVAQVLDANIGSATGDFSTVLGAIAFNTLTSAQGQAIFTSLSGNNYAGFSSAMVANSQLFMTNFANQTGGGGSPVSNRVALAEACDMACDATTSPKWGAWGGALGGLGTIGATQPVGGVTYNVGGFAAGLDRSITENFRLGVTAGYTTGTQWVSGFDGRGTSDTFQAGLYGGFAQDKVYADAIIGYAYSYNQMWRNILVPGLQQRTAQGRTGANQWYGQIESGYRFDIGTAANAFVTPFARLQAYTGTQNAFTETGAQSLNLTVAQQTTNSLRSVLGAQLGGSMDLGWREKLALQLRLGWSHEYADVARPVSATFAGAPASPFTTFGVAPQRDGVVLGLSANTAIAEATSVYLRYEGDISGQDSAHAITAGLRMTW